MACVQEAVDCSLRSACEAGPHKYLEIRVDVDVKQRTHRVVQRNVFIRELLCM